MKTNFMVSKTDSIKVSSQKNYPQFIAEAFQLNIKGVTATISLLNEGATMPFIARYRKEATLGLNEVEIQKISDRLNYLKEFDARKETILNSIQEQGKLTEKIKNQILNCTTKTILEDLYLPFKPKRRTKATIAKEKGLEPLALLIFNQENINLTPQQEALKYLKNDGDEKLQVPSIEDALLGARHIVAEWVSENANVRQKVRENFQSQGQIQVGKSRSVKEQATKYEQYYEFNESIKTLPSHRYLAIRRGEKEGILRVNLGLSNDENLEILNQDIARTLNVKNDSFGSEFKLAIEDSLKRLIVPSVETEIRVKLKMDADIAAIEVFAGNLRNLLMAAPLGNKNVIGIDPGIRTGCKCIAIDHTGKYLGKMTLFLNGGESKEKESKKEFLNFIKQFPSSVFAVGNGTGGRETETWVRKILKEFYKDTKENEFKNVIVVPVNESGASIYSASEVAREEFPDLDLTFRGAISIARRLQDPLAELVKLDPKSIGVGQYQHDVYQASLQKKLTEVVESCVNQVGVSLNTASASLLSHVSGLSKTVAKNIVQHREKNHAFDNRKELLEVAGLGPKAFEQSAGFLRIQNGSIPLDASAVHPERYDLVNKMASDLNSDIVQLVKNKSLVDKIQLENYIANDIGLPTLKDIVGELKRPGRDPRAVFDPPKFRDDINEPKDLKEGMRLDGIVTNVTAFGAFVDVGVHQDGLVHISQLSNNFVKDPSDIVKVGDKISVKVMSVDLERMRIALSARTDVEQKAMGNIKKKTQRKKINKKPEKLSGLAKLKNFKL